MLWVRVLLCGWFRGGWAAGEAPSSAMCSFLNVSVYSGPRAGSKTC